MSTCSVALSFLFIVLLIVLLLYSRTVVRLTRHAAQEIVRYLSLNLGVLFMVLLLFTLWVHG
jgi:hypothetical protein